MGTAVENKNKNRSRPTFVLFLQIWDTIIGNHACFLSMDQLKKL